MSGQEGIHLYEELAMQVKATESLPLRVGNVEFWMDGQDLIFSIPPSQWDSKRMGWDVAAIAVFLPSFAAIVSRYAERALNMELTAR